MRVVWGFAYLLLFKFSPKPFHTWRRSILMIFGAKIGKGAHIYPKVKIWAPWNLEIGNNTGIGDGVNLYSQGKITIGENSVISQGTHICTGTHDFNSPGFKLIIKPITIGSNVWIAAEAFIHPGVSIGDNCVVGARSVVKSNLPANFICEGFPCIPIKERISQSNLTPTK
jgi:putative colanic acid biosynthesis acetyltransferase WcaF